MVVPALVDPVKLRKLHKLTCVTSDSGLSLSDNQFLMMFKQKTW